MDGKQRGFSLIEILVTMAFAPLFGALIYSFTQSSFRAARLQQAVGEAQETAHLALSSMTRDLRQAGYWRAGEKPVALSKADGGSLAVRADLNGDGDFEDSGESVSYQEDGARHTLTRASGAAAPQPMADHLAAGSLRFSYFDRDGIRLEADGGLGLEQRRRVKRIDVSFAVAVPEAAWVHASASVEVRNVGP